MSRLHLRLARYLQGKRLLSHLLFSTAFLDELTTGFLVVALPLVRDDLHLTYEQAGLLFTIGGLSSMVLEPIINVVSDRRSKRIPVIAGMVAVSASFALAAAAHSYLPLVAAVVVLFPANDAAVGLSQAILIELNPPAAERTMTRWTTVSAVGDLLAPLLVTLVLGSGLRWNALFVLAAVVWLGPLAGIRRQRFPQPALGMSAGAAGEEEQPQVSLLVSLREALGDRVLLRWVGVGLMAGMLDEIFLAFSALFLSDRLHAAPVAVGLAVAVFTAGGLLGLLALDRILARLRGTRLLPWLALLTLVGVVGFLIAPSVWLATAALFVIGLCAAGWYPIAQAAAYATRPGRTGTVRAVISCAAPFDVMLPGVVGVVAGHFGILVAVALLGLAPLGVLLLAPRRE